MSNVKKLKNDSNEVNAKAFESIDGSHPLIKLLPEGHVKYKARIRPEGTIRYFNFELAKEMGLISNDHGHFISKELEKLIINTFSLQIINEYDIEHNKKFPKNLIKPGEYMATRYLQLQHDDKVGKSSGDGRSMWNGKHSYRGKTWDISSCGTGATCLSPATSKFNKFFETGDPSISYGCGFGELDEGLASALFSKILFHNNIKTERTLVVLDYGKNASVNVRVHENLIRPSHIFLYLKQNHHESLKSIVDYFISRQVKNKTWPDCPESDKKYDYFLKKFCEDMAHTSADFEDHYIFCWLDWDGDNILMDGSIIDYGSIRQFGIYHHEYRYDDVERFSTTIKEQKSKAKYMVQTFIQAIDYIRSGEKKTLSSFKKDELLDDFEEIFNQRKNYNLLFKVGFTEKHIKQLLKRNSEQIEEFKSHFAYFEKIKSNKGPTKTEDGVNWDVMFSMRRLLREYPQIMLLNDENLDLDDFINVAMAESANIKNIDINNYFRSKVNAFQDSYMGLVKVCAKLFQTELIDILQKVSMRSSIINKSDRVTGDAVTLMVDLLIKKVKDPIEMYELIDDLNCLQNISPDKIEEHQKITPKGLIVDLINIIVEHREGI